MIIDLCEKINHPYDYLAITGSHLYGYATPTSDIDVRGFVLDPDFILSLEKFNQWTAPDGDTVIYSLEKFLKDLIRGNAQHLEILFATDYVSTYVGRWIRDSVDLFISKKTIRSILGFSQAEWQKARAVTRTIVYNDSAEEDAFKYLQGKYQLDKVQISSMYDIIHQNNPDGDIRKEVSTKNKLGERRASEYEKYGYCPKNAAHSIRLLMQGIDLITQGKFVYPANQENIDLLTKIRLGGLKIDEIALLWESKNQILLSLLKDSSLPAFPDTKKINELYRFVCRKAFE